MPHLTPALVAALDLHLRAPDPTDLVSPSGGRRRHHLTHAGKPDRFYTWFRSQLYRAVVTRRAVLLGPLDEDHPS